jgi:hypothetical protein
MFKTKGFLMKPRKYCDDFVTELAPNQVFVFGSNKTGFHGAGTAGFAFRGDFTNTWRYDKTFIKALRTPLGSLERIGRWAVLGKADGFQEGHKGASYAIPTVERAGLKRSIPLKEILDSLLKLTQFARQNPDKEFLVYLKGGGYSGYTKLEFAGLYKQWHKLTTIPDNIILRSEYDHRSHQISSN